MGKRHGHNPTAIFMGKCQCHKNNFNIITLRQKDISEVPGALKQGLTGRAVRTDFARAHRTTMRSACTMQYEIQWLGLSIQQISL